MQPDAPTMALMISVACLTLGGALVWIARGQTVDGLGSWGWCLSCLAFALPLLASGGLTADPALLAPGESLLATALALALAGVCRFQGQPANRLLTLGPVLLIAIALALTAGAGTGQLRAAFVSAVLAMQAALIALAVHRKRGATPGRGHRLITLGSALAAIVLLGRAFAGEPSADPLLAPAQPLLDVGYAGALAAILLCALGFLGMIKERADERNRRLAMHDELTGIANRRALLDELERHRAAAVRRRSPLCLLMVDIDHFKRVNDDFGHAAGDVVLRRIADAIRRRIRAQDAVGRYGGEEFVVILPDTSEAGGMRLARDLCERVGALAVDTDRASVHVTLSIGVHGGIVPQDLPAAGLIRAADDALYRAKRLGRNRVEGSEAHGEGLLVGV